MMRWIHLSTAAPTPTPTPTPRLQACLAALCLAAVAALPAPAAAAGSGPAAVVAADVVQSLGPKLEPDVSPSPDDLGRPLQPRPAALPPDLQDAAPPPPLTARQRDFRHRRAQPLATVRPHAAAILPYAALAHAVYCNDVVSKAGDPLHPSASERECAREDDAAAYGWQHLQDYPDGQIPPDKDHRGLSFSVYFRDFGASQPVGVGVAFRGTDFSSLRDWHSNLRWFLPGRDQYDVLADVAAQVIERSKRDIAARLQRPVDRWHIVTTGHSLGGGLAQLFAYKVADVRGAIVFDPSPVTAFHSCVTDDEVNCNVPVWRVYERGEVLAFFRAFTRMFYPLSENITELEFNLVHGNPIANHSMARFYNQLRDDARLYPTPDAQHAGLFEARPDCACSQHRRKALWTEWQKECHRLQAERQRPSGLGAGELEAMEPSALAALH